MRKSLAITALSFIILLLIYSSGHQRDALGQDAPFSLNATRFISDYIKFLYEIKKVEDPELTKRLKEALNRESDESFITTWIQYAHHFEKALEFIRPYTSNIDPDIRRISKSLVVYLEPLVSDFNHIISINLKSGIHGVELKEVMEKTNERMKAFFGQLQISAIDITSIITAYRVDPKTGEQTFRECKLTGKQLRSILSDIDLFAGDDLMELEDIGLEKVVFGEEGSNIALPHYMWSVLFLKIYMDRAIAREGMSEE